jgi:hypothetical protein
MAQVALLIVITNHDPSGSLILSTGSLILSTIYVNEELIFGFYFWRNQLVFHHSSIERIDVLGWRCYWEVALTFPLTLCTILYSILFALHTLLYSLNISTLETLLCALDILSFTLSHFRYCVVICPCSFCFFSSQSVSKPWQVHHH